MASQESGFETAKIGVPPCSILGTLLFLFYVIDLQNGSRKMLALLFSGDTTLSAKHCNHDKLITETIVELEKLTHWTVVSVSKTFAPLFTNQHQTMKEKHKNYFNRSEVNFSNCDIFVGCCG